MIDPTCKPCCCSASSTSRRTWLMNSGSASARRSTTSANALIRDGLSGTPSAHANACAPSSSPVRVNRSRSQPTKRPTAALAASARFSPPFSAALVSNAATSAPTVNDTGSTKTFPSH